MGPNITTLGEAFATTFAGVRTFTGVATLMCLGDVSMMVPALPARRQACRPGRGVAYSEIS